MPKATAENRAGHITRGNVLEDLGFTAEEIRETEIKMAIWRPLRDEIESRGLCQADVADLLRIHQPDASVLMRGKLAKFSVMNLTRFAERLGLTVRLVVEPALKPRHRQSPRAAIRADFKAEEERACEGARESKSRRLGAQWPGSFGKSRMSGTLR